jgi:seryl-tRNA synthetase
MAEESETKKFFDRLKEATANVTQMTREGVETLQTKRELSQAYAELGRKTAELVQSGAITHADLMPLVDRIAELQEQLEAAETEDDVLEAPPEGEGSETPPASDKE